MDKVKNVFVTIWGSIKRLFVQLFGFGKKKNVLEEEQILSPTRQIFKKFIHNKIAILGLTMLIALVLFVTIGNSVIEFEATYIEGSQQYIQPGTNYLNVPRKLQKVGVKAVDNFDGEDQFLIGSGGTFTVAIGNDNKIYVWGANTSNVKKVPKEIQNVAKDIVQLSVGLKHIVVLTEDGEFYGWGQNDFHQAQKPVYRPGNDATFYSHKKTIEAYFNPEVRDVYEVKSTIEEDPIVKIFAGYNYTIILTSKGYVYTWGITHSSGIGSPNTTFNYYNTMVDVVERDLSWKFLGDAVWKTIKTHDELVDEFNVEKAPGERIDFKIIDNKLQYQIVTEKTMENVARDFAKQFPNTLVNDYTVKTEFHPDFEITWSSSNEEVFTNEGDFNRPLQHEVLTISYDISDGVVTNSYQTTVLVLGSNAEATDTFATVAERFKNQFPAEITGNLSLNTEINGYNIEWTSSNEVVFSNEGKLVRPKNDTIITVSFDITHDEVTNSYTHDIFLPGLDAVTNPWVNTGETVESISAGLDTTKRIVDIYGFGNHVMYQFNDNSFRIMGVPGTLINRAPVELSQTSDERGYRIIDITSSKDNAFALTDEGNIISWGPQNAEAQINIVPADVEAANIVQIVGGSYHVVARDANGKVYTWGDRNDLNQLKMPKGLSSSEDIGSAYFVSYSLNENGKITIWGNRGYIFGTNFQGADVFKRIIAGGGMTMSLAVIAVVISLIIGLTVGLIAGFYGGKIDNILMRFGEIMGAFPFLPLAMTLAVLVENLGLSDQARVYLIMVVLGLLSWPGLSRLVRGQILAEREKDFVLAAKALGIKEKHIITRHILPNVINVVIVHTALSYAGVLLTESGLSFLGFGVKAPNPSWGNMLTSAQGSMSIIRNYWWIWIIPGIFIVLTALSVNLVGDGLRDAMDPKSNER